jgi:hypothetical protein
VSFPLTTVQQIFLRPVVHGSDLNRVTYTDSKFLTKKSKDTAHCLVV